MRFNPMLISTTLFLVLLSACKKEEPAPSSAAATESAVPAAKTEPVPTAATTEATAASAVETPPVNTDFSVESVPVTSVSLPPFPFFKVPDGLVNDYDDKDSNIGFDRHYFLAGNKLVAVEGKLYNNSMGLTNPDSERKYSEIEFHRNYENAITALGGKKISTSQFTRKIIDDAGGLAVVNKYWRSVPPTSGYEHYSYLIRTADKEYWIHIATGAIPIHGYVTVLEKEGMKQSLGFLDASAMKKALDADGHVALYINFDIDKATLRPDSQAVMDEINKLLTANADLKLSIEGHTDSTGSADHNRQLSTSRARSVLGALVGLGIDPARLSSKGFGPDKPISDNANEAGRAKNRRVELVKM
ncbi:MAG: OmpA family protein [Arenimonas sp.]